MGTAQLEVLNGHRECAEHLRRLVRRNARLRRARRQKPQLERYLRAIRSWRRARQVALLPVEPRQRRAARFLLEELMAAVDFESRDVEFERALPFLQRFASPGCLRALAELVEFHTLAQSFDHRSGEIVFETMAQVDVTDDAIAQAQRLINDYRGRAHQIELLRRIAQRLSHLARNALLRPALLALAVLLEPFGLARPVRALARGVAAFSGLPPGSPELAAFLRQQSEALDRIHSGGAPFDRRARVPSADID